MAKKPIELVNIEIDGTPYQVPKHQYVLWSARDLGIDVPHFCAHPWLEPFGGCRMCMAKVELGGRMMPKLQTTCSLLPAEGMKVIFNDPDVLQARREQLEFHLLNHPLECPVCDKGGECMLQDQTRDHGNFAGRYIEQKRVRPDQAMNAYIRLNYKRCIHCKRCVHFAQDVDGSHFLKFIERGAETFIESFADPDVAPRFTGNVIDMCPVGALTARNYRFVMGRPWEQELTPSVGSLDGCGANIWVKTRLGSIARIEPRANPQVRHGMLDDVTRFSFECIEDPRRVVKASVREDLGETQMYRFQAEQQVATLLKGVLAEHGVDSIGVIAGSKLNNEEYVALRRFTTHVLDPHYFHFGDELLGGKTPGPAELSSLAGGADFPALINVSTALSIGCDLFEEAPLLGLRLDTGARRGLIKLLSLRSHRSDADRFAKVFTDYGYGNLLRMVRGLVNGLTGAGDTPPELKPLVAELKDVKEDCAILYGSEVFRDELPGELLAALNALREAIAAANPQAQGVYLNPVFPAVNTAGALLVNHLDSFAPCDGPACKPPTGSLAAVLEAAAQGRLKALVVFDCDLLATYPDYELTRKALAAVPVVYVGPFTNLTAEQARFHLPLGTWAHREGTVLNMEWRLQKRVQPQLTDIAPSVLDIVNSLAGLLGQDKIAEDIPTLYARLANVLPGWSKASFAEFPAAGELLKLTPAAVESLPKPGAELPAEVKGTAGEPLVLVPKRFLYNDCEEIRFSPVFDEVAKPFHAYVNPLDAKVFNLADGEPTVVKAGGQALELTVRVAAWVRQGSLVVNDYCLAAPANALAGRAPVRVQAARPAAVSGS
jgi:NADH-quinone oxidoreductase subunit G